jgi:hypothetical protein
MITSIIFATLDRQRIDDTQSPRSLRPTYPRTSTRTAPHRPAPRAHRNPRTSHPSPPPSKYTSCTAPCHSLLSRALPMRSKHPYLHCPKTPCWTKPTNLTNAEAATAPRACSSSLQMTAHQNFRSTEPALWAVGRFDQQTDAGLVRARRGVLQAPLLTLCAFVSHADKTSEAARFNSRIRLIYRCCLVRLLSRYCHA